MLEMGSTALDLRQLKYFVFVADLQSIARASTHLNVAAPAISRSIGALEEEMKTPLFERDGRGMRLTSAGLLLHRSASQILRDVELARQGVMAEGKHLTGDVIIGATPSVIALSGAPLINACMEELPRVKPRFLEGYSAYLQNWVVTGAIDVAFVNGLQPDTPRLSCERIAVERLFAISAPGTFEQHSSGIKLEHLLQSRLLLPSANNSIRALIDKAASGIGARVEAMLEIDSVGLLKDLAHQGIAPAVLPYGAIKREVESGFLSACPITEPEVRSDLNLVYLTDRPPTRVAFAVIALFVDILRQIVAGDIQHGFVEISPSRFSGQRVKNPKAELPKR